MAGTFTQFWSMSMQSHGCARESHFQYQLTIVSGMLACWSSIKVVSCEGVWTFELSCFSQLLIFIFEKIHIRKKLSFLSIVLESNFFQLCLSYIKFHRWAQIAANKQWPEIYWKKLISESYAAPIDVVYAFFPFLWLSGSIQNILYVNTHFQVLRNRPLTYV